VRLRLSIPQLDVLLGGGVPCGAITEVCGRRSSGRTALAHALVAAALSAGECAAWIDLPNALDPTHAAMAGVVTDCVLWVHPGDPLTALRAAEHVIGGGGFRLVVLDLDDPTRASITLPTSTWLRVTRAALHHDVAVVVLSSAHVAGTFAAVSLELSQHRRVFVGTEGPACLFSGVTGACALTKNKLGPPGSAPVELCIATDA
jgi:hypothetical protein